MLGVGVGVCALPRRGLDQAPLGLSYGNATYPARGTASNAPATRRLAILGDSRPSGTQPSQFAAMVMWSIGEWVWALPGADESDPDYEFAVGGSTIYHAVNTQAPQALAKGCSVFVVMTGTNGAREAGEGDGVDTFATRQIETQNLLAALDQPGATIFLCNEMPGRSDGGTFTGTEQIKVDHHNWINTLTTANAGLTNADLVIVNTWDAISDGGVGVDANLNPRWVNDGLHPATQGQERTAMAVWEAMNAHFGSEVQLDFSAPSQNLLDGSTTVSEDRGVLPGGWRDFNAADALVYSTAGTGLETVLTVTNGGGSNLTTNARVSFLSPVTDGVLFIDYSIDPDPDADQSIGVMPNYGPRIVLRECDFGTGVMEPIFGTASVSVNTQSMDYHVGGRRRLAAYIGAASVAAGNVQLSFLVAAGMTLKVHRVEIHER